MQWKKQRHTGHRGSRWTLTDQDQFYTLGAVEFHERNKWDGKLYFHALALTEPAGTPLSKQPWALVPGAKAARQWVEAKLAAKW